MAIIRSSIQDKKQTLNAMMNSKACKDFVGVEMEVIGYVIYTEATDSGEERVITAVVTSDGESFGSVSPNIRKTLTAIEETLGEITPENPIKLVWHMEKSKNGRDFLNVTIV